MSVSVPSSGDSHSIVALSVSISAITSPADTLSPFFFFHATRVPSVIVSLSFGIWISGMAKSLGVTNLLHGRDQLFRARQDGLFEFLIVGHRHIFLGDAQDRGIQSVEHLLL